jgi:hypothetical protein
MAKDFAARSKLAEEDCINFMNWGLGMYPTDLPLLINTAWAIRRLCRHHGDNARKIFDSKILKHISRGLGKNIDSNEFAEHACNAIINITYKNHPNKVEIGTWSAYLRNIRVPGQRLQGLRLLFKRRRVVSEERPCFVEVSVQSDRLASELPPSGPRRVNCFVP